MAKLTQCDRCKELHTITVDIVTLDITDKSMVCRKDLCKHCYEAFVMFLCNLPTGASTRNTKIVFDGRKQNAG